MTDSSRRLKGLTNKQLKGLHHAAQGDFERRGYDASRDVTLDWDGPTNAELNEARQINFRHYDPPEHQMTAWGEVRDMLGLKAVNTKADLQSMFREVNNEYSARQIDKATGKLEERIAELEAGAASAPEVETEATAPEQPSEKLSQARDVLSNGVPKFGPSQGPANFMKTGTQQGQQFLDGAKDAMKQQLNNAGVRTRGAGSPLFGTGKISDVFDSFKTNFTEQDQDRQTDPTLDPRSVNDFANEYKLNIAGGLLPSDRRGQN